MNNYTNRIKFFALLYWILIIFLVNVKHLAINGSYEDKKFDGKRFFEFFWKMSVFWAPPSSCHLKIGVLYIFGMLLRCSF